MTATNLRQIRGYKTLEQVADCIHTSDDDSSGRSALYVGREDCWGLWVDRDGNVDIDSTMPGKPPYGVAAAAKKFALRIFA